MKAGNVDHHCQAKFAVNFTLFKQSFHMDLEDLEHGALLLWLFYDDFMVILVLFCTWRHLRVYRNMLPQNHILSV